MTPLSRGSTVLLRSPGNLLCHHLLLLYSLPKALHTWRTLLPTLKQHLALRARLELHKTTVLRQDSSLQPSFAICAAFCFSARLPWEGRSLIIHKCNDTNLAIPFTIVFPCVDEHTSTGSTLAVSYPPSGPSNQNYVQTNHSVAIAATSGAPPGQVGPALSPSPALTKAEHPAAPQPDTSHTADLSTHASSAADLALMTHQGVQPEAEEWSLLQRRDSHGSATTSDAAQSISNNTSSSNSSTVLQVSLGSVMGCLPEGNQHLHVSCPPVLCPGPIPQDCTRLILPCISLYVVFLLRKGKGIFLVNPLSCSLPPPNPAPLSWTPPCHPQEVLRRRKLSLVMTAASSSLSDMQGVGSDAQEGSDAWVGSDARVGPDPRAGSEVRVGSEGRSSYNSSTLWKASSSDQETVNSNASGMQISFLGTASSVDCRSRYLFLYLIPSSFILPP